MGKLYTFLAISLMISTNGHTQGCPTNLFFSEYVEGSSNNKVLEIYNPLPYTVDLSDYVIERYTNGSTTVSASFFLGSSIAPGQTYVICNGLSSAPILALADTVSGVLNFNGDDAIVLKHEFTFDTLDIIGIVGVDPGTFWVVGTGTTENKTLVRNSNIGIGTTDWSVSVTQWTVFPLDYFDSLGTHYSNAPSNSYSFQNFTICDNDSVFVQMTHYESLPGIYYDTLSSINGCDSIIVTELFTNPTYLVMVDTSTCPGGSLFLGGSNQTVPGLYYDYYTTTLGCDSIIEFNFTFYIEEFVQLNETICEGDSLFLEGGWQLLDGVYTDIYASIVTGCDSIVETTLTINVVDVSLTVGTFDITANATGVTYQWADCGAGYTELAGETNQFFAPIGNGFYSVEITEAGCVDTSACILLEFEGIDETGDEQFLLYPNPAHSNLVLDLGKTTSAIIEIIDVNGKLIRSVSVNEKQFVEIDLNLVQSGIYFVSVITENGKTTNRLVKD